MADLDGDGITDALAQNASGPAGIAPMINDLAISRPGSEATTATRPARSSSPAISTAAVRPA
jgi:hypothetical protein